MFQRRFVFGQRGSEDIQKTRLLKKLFWLQSAFGADWNDCFASHFWLMLGLSGFPFLARKIFCGISILSILGENYHFLNKNLQFCVV